MYKLGVIGLGHWVKRLQHVLKSSKKMTFFKAVAIKPYEERKGELESYQIPKERYFSISAGAIPEEFFDQLDVVHIASHNKYHSDQTIQCLKRGKMTIVEKTLAVNRKEFDRVMQYIGDNGLENKIMPHLHYLGKALTIEMKNMLPGLLAGHGKIKRVDAVFFERANEEDARRGWLFSPENGGIFLDWIHPVEILVHVLKAGLEIENVETYIVKPEYDAVNPSAVGVDYRIIGDSFSGDARAVVKVGKGFDIDGNRKSFVMMFEDGAMLKLDYLDTDEEMATGKRGKWELIKGGEIISDGEAKGPLSYEILIEEVTRAIETGVPMMTLDEMKTIYEHAWQFQEISKDMKPIKDEERIRNFVEK